VETTHGTIAGRYGERNVQAFRGIPYGAATGGSARFRPPAPAESWTGVRDCFAFGPTAPQSGVGNVASNVVRVLATGLTFPEQSEDCLVLNVWTSGCDDAQRPVMVWIHGGLFTIGSGSAYDGSFLAGRGDVVVVTLNHRLGACGYLYLDALSDGRDEGSSGNVGMLDIVQALEWVRDNIAGFGGDPANVTIFGESGGGMKVSVLLGMPTAHGLFDKAIVESGPMLRVADADQATEVAERVLAHLGIGVGELDRLADVPIAHLLGAQAALESGLAGLVAFSSGRPLPGFSPVLDGGVIPAHPFDPVASPLAADVALLIGTNKDESTLFLAGHPKFGCFDDDDVASLAESVHGDAAPDVLALYASARPEATPDDLYVAMMMTDRWWIDSIRLAERKTAGGPAPVFMYSFAYETDVLDGKLKSAHALEIPFVFADAHQRPFAGSRPERLELAARMSSAWVAFARSGDPNHEGIPAWSPYSPECRATMIFDIACRVDVDPRRELRAGLSRVE
jgi:para-nitrobenzyl esterase